MKESGCLCPADLHKMATAVRFLSVDSVENAGSGHPGAPLGLADAATCLFANHYRFDPEEPRWPGRDRFVLSVGHASAMLYALGHLFGYADLPLAALKRFRRLGAPTAGHPEYGHTSMVETTTGPLGQGLGAAVGMAMARAHLESHFDDLAPRHVYCFVGDGCLMEGISEEAASLAGHLRLPGLIVLFDDNGITIDGAKGLADSTDQEARFAAHGWRVMRVDGHDLAALDSVFHAAKSVQEPVFIACKTRIGLGAGKKEGSAAAHGAPLGAEALAALRSALNWPHPPFFVPEDIRALFLRARAAKHRARKAWADRLCAHPQGEAFLQRFKPDALFGASAQQALVRLGEKWAREKPAMATRSASGVIIKSLFPLMPELFGGSADLSQSTQTMPDGEHAVFGTRCYGGRFVHFGIREHAMVAALNGVAGFGGFIAYGGTFLVFTDYARPALRLAAMMGLRVIFIGTHDSIGLGEDGPTHQPIEHLASLRAIPGLRVYRPCDAMETLECWEAILGESTGPALLALTRQKCRAIATLHDAQRVRKGGYVVRAVQGKPDWVLIASGSEVAMALLAADILQKEGTLCMVVSMPCVEAFLRAPAAYKAKTLPDGARWAVIEAALRFGWDRLLREGDLFIGVEGYGASAPAEDLFAHFGLSGPAIAARLRAAGQQPQGK